MHSIDRIRAKHAEAQETYYETGLQTLRTKGAYGFTTPEWNALNARLLAEQGNKCAVCWREFTQSRRPNLDHNHETLVIRGLVCGHCNAALKQIRDETLTAYRLWMYLLRSDGIEAEEQLATILNP